ncbi:recombinase family protein [Bradyrhizobium sp. USDA 10063]
MDQPSPKAPQFCTLEGTPAGRQIRAAQYMRMSTDLQKYSIENQAAAIAAYAIQRNFSIVRSYQDDGRSGLHIDGRDALKELIETVQRGRADFEAILVYDVSRWGRFQNTDESAYYEFICSEAGIRIHYCAEQFENDGSLLSTIIKNIKRAMAAEYSRELSTKVFAGHCRLVRMGFRQGGPPGYGLRRMLVDENRQPKVLLKPGERKCLQTDHVVLRPGNSREVKVVRHIFDLFVRCGKSESQIACELNADGVLNHCGRAWSGSTVRNLLRNENYIGNNVYNRMNLRLGQKARRNPPDLVIRAPEVFEPIVDKSIFLQAQEKIQPQRRLLLTSDEMLSRLRTVLQEKGRLSRTIIDKSPILPTNDVYAWRFGGLKNAYSLIGYFPDENFRNVEAKHALVETLSAAADEIVAGIENARQWAAYDPATSVLTVNGALTVSISIARCVRDRKWPRWISSRRIDYTRDLYLAARMNETNSRILDYLLLPAPQMLELKRISFAQKKLRQLRDYRIKNIDGLIQTILAHQKHRDVQRTVVGKNGIGK